MAKQQTFGDKLKKKKGDDKISVKVIKSYRTDDGKTRFIESFIKVNDLSELDSISVSK